MGGIYSGRKSSDKPSVEDLPSLDVCDLYRRGYLEPGVVGVIQLSNGQSIEVAGRANYLGWQYCVVTRHLARKSDGRITLIEQTIGIEITEVLNGKAQRPYFRCPRSEKRAGVLILGSSGFAHRTFYRYLYRIQRQGHFDRAVTSGRKIKERLGCSEREAATDPPERPKGMHWKIFNKLKKKHARAVEPIMAKIGYML